MVFVKQISAKETISVRHEVLRAGKPIESCSFDGDDLASTVHFGIFENNFLCGVASVFQKKLTAFDVESQCQLRGMAILSKAQDRGFGKLLLKEIEIFLRTLKTKILWFNAREAAIVFYEKMGFIKYGAIFDIPTIGVHVLMYKEI